MNGIISFVIFWDWLLLLSVCFWGLSVLQHAPVLHLSPPPRFFLSARLCVLPLSIHVAGGAVVSSSLIQLTFIDCCCVPDTSLGAYYFMQSTLHLSSTCHTWGHWGFLFYFSLYMCVCVYLKIYLFTFGYAGSSLLRGLSLVWQVGLLFVAVCGFTVMASLAERRL